MRNEITIFQANRKKNEENEHATSVEDHLSEKRARSEKFFRTLKLCCASEQRSSCGAEQRRNEQSFVADT